MEMGLLHCFQLFAGGPSCVAPSFNRDRNSFELNIDEAGYLEDTSESMVLKVEKDIDGDGQITYIFVKWIA